MKEEKIIITRRTRQLNTKVNPKNMKRHDEPFFQRLFSILIFNRKVLARRTRNLQKDDPFNNIYSLHT